MTESYGKIHDQIINKAKYIVYEKAEQDSFIAKRAWKKAWKDLEVDNWGNAEHWTNEQKHKLIDTVDLYIPKRFTNGDTIAMIKEVFGEVVDITHKLEDK